MRLYLYSLFVFIVGYYGVQQGGAILKAKPLNTVIFLEDFTAVSLADWEWVREDPTAWSLFARPGYLRMTTQTGTLDEENTIENLLLREAPAGDFELSTRLEFTPTARYHEASLFLYVDDDNYIKLSRLYSDNSTEPDTYFLQQERAGQRVKGFHAPAAEAITELTLRVDARFIVGLYKNQEGAWVTLGQFPLEPNVTYPQLGISAYHGITRNPSPPIAVDFDFIKVETTEFSYLFLPYIQK